MPEFVRDPCMGVLWECTDGIYSGYGNTQGEALSGFNEAKQLKRTQATPRMGADGKRKYW